MSDDNHKGPVDRALDVFVYAPLGLALLARDSAPGLVHAFVERGRAEIETRRHDAESKLEQAKAVGRFALDFGVPKLRKGVETRISEARGRAGQPFGGLGREERPTGVPAAPPHAAAPVSHPAPAPTPTATPTPTPTPRQADRADAVGANGAHAATMPAGGRGGDMTSPALSIPDYDELSASQVVQRLPGLSADELEAIRAYETRGRGRRTILGKIDQLAR